MTRMLPAVITLVAVGGLLFLAFILLGRTRTYLLYLGAAFLACGVALLLTYPLRWLPLAVALIAVLIAFHAAYRETQQRLHRMRVEQQQREEAFAEYLTALAHAHPDADRPKDTPAD